MNKRKEAKDLLEQFWIWLGKTSEEYAENGLDYFNNYGHMECDFPEFENLKGCAVEIVNKNTTSKEELYDLLTIMAIDNEEQSVQNYIKDNNSDDQLENIIKIGISHPQKNARQQLITLIFIRKPIEYRNYLSMLADDTKLCVQRRAKNALEFLSEEPENSENFKKLQQFWIWLGKTSEKYGKEGIPQIYGKEEHDFPFFEDLLEYARTIVDLRILSEKELDALFIIMALDNESENTLDYIEAHSCEEQINELISFGINHEQFQGRWQLAELIYRRRPSDYEEYLIHLSKDSDIVVSSRAQNLLKLLKEH